MNENHFPELTRYLHSVLSDCPDYLKKLEVSARAEQIPIVYPDTARFLDILVRINRPKNILELGTAVGYSALWMAQSLGPDSTIYTIEASKPNIEKARKNIEAFAPEKKILIQEAWALDYLSKDTKEYDLIFVDSEKGEYLEILELAVPRLSNKGIIVFDNVLWHGQVAGTGEKIQRFQKAAAGLQKFNTAFVKHPKLTAEIIPIGDGIGLGVKKDV